MGASKRAQCSFPPGIRDRESDEGGRGEEMRLAQRAGVLVWRATNLVVARRGNFSRWTRRTDIVTW